MCQDHALFPHPACNSLVVVVVLVVVVAVVVVVVATKPASGDTIRTSTAFR